MLPQFQPLSFSWVALHPQPKGVIQFIGGAFFGTFPTIFYRHLLDELFQAGYTLVALPFRFSFRHWSIALSLLDEQQSLRQLLPAQAQKQGYAADVYLESASYFWLGHSLGCKYIALLELLSGKNYPTAISEVIDAQTAEWLQHKLAGKEQAICNQPSLLMAPDISDTTTAIPIKSLAHLLDRLGLGVRPTRQQTQRLIDRSQLFRLTGMISFDRDTVAGSIQDTCEAESDVLWLYRHLQTQGLLHDELLGKHLEPLGVRVGGFIVDLNLLDKFLKPLSQWQTGAKVLTFLEELSLRLTPTASDPVIPTASTHPSIQKAVAVGKMEATINDVASSGVG
ncbi:MAG: DUF1350 family protein [Cyanobacteria bacterium Co-bin8]|nr:DUF1350 family protein [Cyanobacteria bacterium Co-bin8]